MNAELKTSTDSQSDQGRTLVVGLGNPLLGDDRIGLVVLDALKAELTAADRLDFLADHRGGLSLMERMIGYDKAIIIDACISGAQPGTISVLPLADACTWNCDCAHDTSLYSALAMGRALGAALPEDAAVTVVAIEAAAVMDFSEQLSSAVTQSVPLAVRTVRALLQPPAILGDQP